VTQYRITLFLLWGSIFLYIFYFSWYSINRHNTLNSYAADLSLIDQPMWNTVIGPGGFMELTWGKQQQPRLAEHFEPILVPLALLFYLWDDVRILLIAQSIALAIGALPIFWITRHCFQPKQNDHAPISRIPYLLSLTFPLIYLLSPHLQAANIADFHADPFVVAPLLFAFWYANQQRWRLMWLWAIIAMSTKETLPPLTAMLGLWLILSSTKILTFKFTKPVSHGLGLIIISTLWFLGATFLIVSPLAQTHFGTDGPIYLTNRYTNIQDIWFMLQDSARWRYIVGLFASVGFLALLAPKMLLLGLPVLIANFFSNFAGQYSGEQHYSAPLVVAFVVAAIYGTQRLWHWAGKSHFVLIGLCMWGLSWSIGYQTQYGWTPFSVRTEQYVMTPQAQLLPKLLAQIPKSAIVTASPAIHPHLAHRKVIYLFPIVEQAEYMLIDVTDISGVHPHDVQQQIMQMLTNEWQLLSADYGLILAKREDNRSPTPEIKLPTEFFDFARINPTDFMLNSEAFSNAKPFTLESISDSKQSSLPQEGFAQDSLNQPLVQFGEQLQLLAYHYHDDFDDGVTIRFYWRTITATPDNLQLWPLIYNDQGKLLVDPTLVPQIETVWYPPSEWQIGEIIVTETLPHLLPNRFHVGLAVGSANGFHDPAQHLPLITQNDQLRTHNHWVHLATFQRPDSIFANLPLFLAELTPQLPNNLAITSQTQFGSHITLQTHSPLVPTPYNSLNLTLHWTTNTQLSIDYTVFIHVLDDQGSLITQTDNYPSWIFNQPTSQWPVNQPILDHHTIELPSNLPAGHYTVQLGLYDVATLTRLTLPDGRNALTLGRFEIE